MLNHLNSLNTESRSQAPGGILIHVTGHVSEKTRYYQLLLLNSLNYCKDLFDEKYSEVKNDDEQHQKQMLIPVIDKINACILLLETHGFNKQNIKLVQYLSKDIYTRTESIDLDFYEMHHIISEFCKNLLE